jgi:hypothetical protein
MERGCNTTAVIGILKYRCALNNSTHLSPKSTRQTIMFQYTNKMDIYNKIHVLIITFFLHVSALIAPSSGRTYLYAQNCCNILWLHMFATFIPLLKKNPCLFQRETIHIKVHVWNTLNIVLNISVCRSACCFIYSANKKKLKRFLKCFTQRR